MISEFCKHSIDMSIVPPKLKDDTIIYDLDAFATNATTF